MKHPDWPAGPAAVDLQARFRADVLDGLARPRKSLPCTWLYDRLGSELFERITGLAEYYPTRTEIGILRSHASDIGARVGPGATVIEFGSGSSRKTPLLLHALDQPRAYVPVDVSDDFLIDAVAALEPLIPGVPCHPVVADFSSETDLRLAAARLPATGRRLGFFPGSTLGNFTPIAAVRLLRAFGHLLGPDSRLVLGIDRTRDPEVLIPAYDDPLGITAQFNLNLLRRLQEELGAELDRSRFRHQVRFDPVRSRIEMHLLSVVDQDIRVLGRTFRLARGETIHTENSYKHPERRLERMLECAGWRRDARWTDREGRFAVELLQWTDPRRSPGGEGRP